VRQQKISSTAAAALLAVCVTCLAVLPTLASPPSSAPGIVPSYAEGTATDLPGENATLDDYLRTALLRNPGVEAAYHDWIRSLERVPQVEALPDPRLTYGYYVREVETRVGAQQHSLGASQTFPWPGKLALRGKIAAQDAEEAHQRFEAEKLRLFFRTTAAYAEYYYLARTIEITRESVKLLSYWERLARARYRVATGRYPDVIKAQVELGQLQDRLRAVEDLRTPLAARLNEVLNLKGTEPFPWPKSLPRRNAAFTDGELTERLKARNPALKALDARIAEQEHRIKLARKEYFPDLTFGFQWIETDRRSGQSLADNGKDPLIGTVSVNLPIWWNKLSAGVREAEAGRAAAAHRRADEELTLSTSLQIALYEFRDAERKINLYRDGLIPKAREALAATFTAYESERADFLDLLDTQRVLLDFQLAYERALANHAERLAEIEMLVGETLALSSDAATETDHKGESR